MWDLRARCRMISTLDQADASLRNAQQMLERSRKVLEQENARLRALIERIRSNG